MSHELNRRTDARDPITYSTPNYILHKALQSVLSKPYTAPSADGAIVLRLSLRSELFTPQWPNKPLPGVQNHNNKQNTRLKTFNVITNAQG